MAQADSDALVIFGASGELAAKMLFPALYGLSATGRINIPIVVVMRRAWTRESLLEHVHESIARHRSLNATTFDALASRLYSIDAARCVDHRKKLTCRRLSRTTR